MGIDDDADKRRAAALEQQEAMLMEGMRKLKEQLEAERTERKYQEELVAYEKEESERLQKELEKAQQQPKQQPKQEEAKPKKGAAAAGGWAQHTSKNGRPFWYNSATKESSWTDPNA